MKTSKLSIGLLGILTLSLFGCCHEVEECDIETYKLNCDGDVLYACVPQEDGSGRISDSEGVCRDGVPVLNDDSVLKPEPNPPADESVAGKDCDSSSTPVCENGSMLSCQNGKYAVQEKAIACNGSEILSCQGNELVSAKYTCSDVDVMYCEDNKLYSSSLICDGDKFVSCQIKNGVSTAVASDCSSNKVCRSFDRNGSTNFACVEISDDSGCGDITNAGSCDDSNVLTFCSKKTEGKLLKLDCNALHKSCEKVNDSYGFDCVEKCGEAQEYTDFGSCTDNVLNYCSNGKVMTVNCSEHNLTCKFGSGDQSFYECF